MRKSNEYIHNVKTVRKQQLLEKMGYIYVNVPYYEWNGVKNDNDSKKEYIKSKLDAAVLKKSGRPWKAYLEARNHKKTPERLLSICTDKNS